MNKIIILFFIFTTFCIQAEELEVGFLGINTQNVNFRAFERYIEERGAQDIVALLTQDLKHIKMTYNFNSRYVMIAAIDNIKFSSVTFGYPNDKEVFLGECNLHVLVFDCQLQQNVMRYAFTGYDCITKESNISSLDLLKSAFFKSIRLAGEQLKIRLHNTGKIVDVSSLGKITINLGTKHNVLQNNIFQVFDSNGKFVDDYSIQRSKLSEENCVAISENDVDISGMDWSNFTVKMKISTTTSEIINDEVHLFAKTLGIYKGHIRDPFKKQLVPNPPQSIVISSLQNGSEIYMGSGKTPSTSILKAIGIDNWGDEVVLVEKDVQWLGENGAENMISRSQLIHKTPGKDFSIRAQYGKFLSDAVKISLIRIKNIELNYKKITVLPQQPIKLRVKGWDTEGREVDSISLEHQVEWSISNSKLGEISKGEFIPKESAGSCFITVHIKSNHGIKTSCEVLVLPPINIDILNLDGHLLPESLNLAPKETIKLQYQITHSTIDTSLIPIEWFVEPEGYGEGEIVGTKEWSFTAGENSIRGIKIHPKISFVPPNTRRTDQIKTLYISIAHKKSDRLQITFSPKPDFFYVDESFQIKVQGFHEQEVLKNLNLDIRTIPSQNSLSPIDEGYGYYSISPKISGPMTILARDKDSGVEASVPIIVKEQEQVSKIEIATEKHRREIRPGNSLLFTAKAFKSNKEVKDARFYWKIIPQLGKTNIDQGGLLTADIEDEEREYEVVVTEEISKKEARLKVRVVPEPIVSIKVEAPEKLTVGEKYPLNAKIIGKDGNKLKRKIEWKLHGQGVIDENGFISGLEPGYIRVFPVSEKFEGESVVIKIENATWGGKVPNSEVILKQIQKIDVASETQKSPVSPGEKIRFIARIISTNGDVLSNIPVNWKVSNSAHKIGLDGYFVAGNKEGTVDIIAQTNYSEVIGTYKITVRWPSIADIKIDSPVTIIHPGQLIPINYNVIDKKGQQIYNYNVNFQVDGGKITKQDSYYEYEAPSKEGKYRILCFDSHYQVSSNPLIIQVKKENKSNGKFDSIKIYPNYKEVEVGEVYKFNAKGFNANTQQYFPNIKVYWNVDNNEHSIDQTGLFRAGASEGSMYVYARTGNISSRIRLVVKRSPRQIKITPYSAKLWTKTKKQFTATVVDALERPINSRVIWSCTGNNIINSYTGEFTAGHEPGTYQVKAEIEGIYRIAEVEITSDKRSNFVYHNLFGIKYLAHKDWKKQSFIETQNIYFIDENTAIYGEAMYVGDLQQQDLDKQINSIEQIMFATFGKYDRQKIRDFAVGSLRGKMVDYVANNSETKTLARSFYGLANNYLYIFYFASLAEDWKNNWDIFKITLFSIEVDKNFLVDDSLLEIREERYNVSYKVNSNWKKEITTNSDAELAIKYWRNNSSFIQFDFFPSYEYSLEQWFALIEANTFPLWFSSNKLLEVQNHTINGIQGKLATYNCKPTNAPNQEYRSKIFLGVRDGNVYGVYYLYSLDQSSAFELPFTNAMNSLRIGKTTSELNQSSNLSTNDKWINIDVQNFKVSYKVKPEWRKELVMDSPAEVAHRYWLDNLTYVHFDFFKVPKNAKMNSLIPFVAHNLFGTNFYSEVKRADDNINGLSGKRVFYRSTIDGVYYDFEIFHAIHQEIMYIALCVCISENSPNKDFILKSLNSLQVHNLKNSQNNSSDKELSDEQSFVKTKTVYHPHYDISYQIPEDWRKEQVADSSAEVAYRYWKNDFSAILFDFFPIAPSVNIDFLIPQVEVTLFSNWCTYSSTKMENHNIGKLKGKKVTYQLTQHDVQQTKYQAQIFYAIYQKNAYVVYYACPLDEKPNHQKLFADAMNSLFLGKMEDHKDNNEHKVDENIEENQDWKGNFENLEKELGKFGEQTEEDTNKSKDINWIETQENIFGAQYKIQQSWRSQKISDTKEECAYTYWDNDTSYIQFDFFPLPLNSQIEDVVSVVAPNIFGSWCREYRSVSTTDHEINGLKGKRYSYKLIQNDQQGTEYYCNLFLGESNNNIYLVFYICLLSNKEEIEKSFMESMFSLKVQNIKQATENKHEIENTTYNLIIKNAIISQHKKNGQEWDFGWGKTTLPDTFVVIKEKNSGKKFVSQICKNSVAPIWDQVSSIIVKANTTIEISVYDKDSSTNDKMGNKQVTLSLEDLKKGELTIQFGDVQTLKLHFIKSS